MLASSTCPTLLPTDSSLLSLWLLDDDAHDLMNKYNGTVLGSPLYTTGYIGQAIKFSNDGLIFMSHIDFYRRSFTIEMWFSLTNTTNPNMALFSECTSAIDNQCLHIEIDGILGFRMGFGTTILMFLLLLLRTNGIMLLLCMIIIFVSD